MPVLCTIGCGWDPRKPFEHDATEVKQAAAEYDAGDARAAATTLEDYLGTGACHEGAIGAPDTLNAHREGTFDLGVALFAIADAYGARFQSDGKGAAPPDADPKARADYITCALRVVRAVLDAPESNYRLRAKAHYLEGNLHFLSGEYRDAVTAYEKALVLIPGEKDGGASHESVGEDAAWNRAIALRRIEDQKDAGPDASPDASPDGGGDGGNDGGNDASPDGGNDGGGDSGSGDSGKDSGGDSGGNDKPDGGNDAASNPPPEPPDSGANEDSGSPPPEQNEDSAPDERILNDLERAPMLQHELSRRAAQNRKVRGAADK